MVSQREFFLGKKSYDLASTPQLLMTQAMVWGFVFVSKQ